MRDLTATDQVIKVYSLEEQYAFHVQRMEDIFEKASGATDTPHRHDYYTVIWVKEGEGNHVIDFSTYPLEKNAIYFVNPGQVHQVDTHTRPAGWVVTFSKEFLQHQYIDEGFIQEVNLFKPFGENPPLIIDKETAGKLENIMEMMDQAFRSNLKYKIAALGAYIKLFLIYCDTQCALSTTPDQASDHKGKQLLKTFKGLVKENFHLWHKVSEYAREMNISPKYLNQVVKSLIGQTAKEVIQEKIILNAKRELRFSEKSIKEIAYSLGFEEPLHFSGFFKKCTGTSPTAFRAN